MTVQDLEKYIKYENGISNVGNTEAIQKVMSRAAAGESIKLGFIGGSITQGSLSSTPETCYAYLVYKWWCANFPKAEFTYINAGIGGTTSQFGVARAEDDLLQYAPDFVIVEFSVNDDSTEHFKETYEGLVRKVLASPSHPAVMLVHNVFYNNGGNAQLMHARIARHYDLPAVSMQSTIYKALADGAFDNRVITPDDLHPNDNGHALVSRVITYYLDRMKSEAEGSRETEDIRQSEDSRQTADIPAELPKPLTANAYEDSVRYRNDNSTPVLKGFVADMEPQSHITDCFKKGWRAAKTGDSIKFEVEGSCIALQFRKTIKLPAPVAEAVIDGCRDKAVVLDANFDETWGDKLELYTLLEHGENKKHTVEITITKSQPENASDFYLVSVIGSGR
ncbi:MAG: SGNH/GDSL hydrolase family protein [Lachnospiraceae bacterium]